MIIVIIKSEIWRGFFEIGTGVREPSGGWKTGKCRNEINLCIKLVEEFLDDMSGEVWAV